MRKTKEELDKIKKKYNVDTLWSWSRYSTYKTSPYEYLLKYVLQKEEDRQDCIYAPLGSLSHDILEKLYLKEIKYEDMIGLFEDSWFTLNLADLKFNRNDEEKNDKIAERYYANMQHFFKNHKPIDRKVDIERFITIKIGKYIFIGYIDMIYKDDKGNVVIQDHKTSTIYKGKKIDKESGQLRLYAEGLRQLGVPLEKIKICWNFLKYCKVTIQQANGTKTTREIERIEIGKSLKSNAKMWLNKAGYSKDEIDNYLDLLVKANNIEHLPKEIQEKYRFDDCYVYIPLNEQVINELKEDIVLTLDEIVEKEKVYKETQDDKLFWDSNVKENSFYFSTLCGYSGRLHKPYGEYLDERNGLMSKVNDNTSDNDIDDLSWLDGLD